MGFFLDVSHNTRTLEGVEPFLEFPDDGKHDKDLTRDNIGLLVHKIPAPALEVQSLLPS